MFENIIKNKRTFKGWTKAELSRRTGISQQMLCDMEAGRRNPSIENLVKLAIVLEFSLDDLLLKKEVS